jgi:hypothetical protein
MAAFVGSLAPLVLLILGDAEHRASKSGNSKNQSHVHCWQGDQGMKTLTVAFALGTALVLCDLGASISAAQARRAKIIREPQERLIVRVPVERPYWDSNIVPRYRYRPEDDRVDPYGPPVVPVIRYGNQEETVPYWFGYYSAW